MTAGDTAVAASNEQLENQVDIVLDIAFREKSFSDNKQFQLS